MRKGKREMLDYLQDILDAIESAESFVADMDYDAFEADEKTNFAAVRALEIVGEASKKIPPDIRREYPDVPWREMAGMRDKLSHDYFGVNLQRVFETVRRDLPPLRASIKKIVDELETAKGDLKI
ncbi:MAG: DUF86 domain-containing protein [Methanothrix sp.]|jgi:uncharacterized protein with HEPN domain|uniref:Nucleotidyltransferase n=1 Tax=Methanothrix harundinacea TaxID=301375 RepID=A0A101ILS4_9EURY|nr:MAG: hypothetical protein APR56_04630 [Methanosaeta sp. SDB]KUK45186.1 MAG: Nucleotidyltransferase [Methanothrix harundinacea]MDD2639149.1 DUF86 domain-containing protein [Methanothrix sp.]MDI9398616.1 DUF86 domain-containing protein [Euryarchaeota archaeon]KUK97491.1 MAG: Nucleotidyltransferase [Methanothrix harundinacea]